MCSVSGSCKQWYLREELSDVFQHTVKPFTPNHAFQCGIATTPVRATFWENQGILNHMISNVVDVIVSLLASGAVFVLFRSSKSSLGLHNRQTFKVCWMGPRWWCGTSLQMK